MTSDEADIPDGRHSVVDTEKNTTPQQLLANISFYPRKGGIIIIILIIAIVIGVIVGGAVGGTKVSALAAQRHLDSATSTTPAVATVVTTMTTSPASSASTTTTPVTSTTVVTSTLIAPSPKPSNCVWEGTAPFCDGKCHTGFTQIKEDNCGSGDCCATGLKVYCCQE